MSIISTGAGHGGLKTNGNWRDSGAVGSGYQEADVARTINAKIIAKTKVPDTTDNAGTSQNDNLAKITAKINACGDGWALSNHLNSFNGSATGVEVLYGSPSSKPMAEAMSKAIADALGLPNRGAKDGTWLYIAKHSQSGKKVLLIEWGFIDNPNDMKALMANMDKAIDAMLACFGYSPSQQPTPIPPASKPNNYKIGSIIIPKSNPKMSYYVVNKGQLGYVIATGTEWRDSKTFSTAPSKVKVGSIVQDKNSKFSFYVANIRKYSDSRIEYLIATKTKDIAYDAVK